MRKVANLYSGPLHIPCPRYEDQMNNNPFQNYDFVTNSLFCENESAIHKKAKMLSNRSTRKQPLQFEENVETDQLADELPDLALGHDISTQTDFHRTDSSADMLQ